MAEIRRRRATQIHGARAARHRRLGQPLRRSVRGRERLRLDRCPFWIAWLGAQNRHRVPETRDEMRAWLRGKGVRLVGGGLDEAPQAYRRLPDVLAHHTGTVKIEHTLRPFAVLMAGADVLDPFKD